MINSKLNILIWNGYFDTVPAFTFNGRHFGSLSAQTDGGFKEVLARIGEAHPASYVGETYRKNKTIKEVKTKEIVKKHINKMRRIAR